MRYFIVFFCINTPRQGNGHSALIDENYPNQKEFSMKILKERGDVITITNIIELNETDFNNFIK